LVKSGVNLNGVHFMLWYAVAVYDYLRLANGLREGTITGGRESAPGRVKDTLHPSGRAVDLRTNDIPANVRQPLANELQRSLGDVFDVVLESDHIHVEYIGG